MAWVVPEKDMAVSQQCELAGVSRATVHAQCKPQFVRVVELLLCRLIDEEYRHGAGPILRPNQVWSTDISVPQQAA
jgi:hypothetical protein